VIPTTNQRKEQTMNTDKCVICGIEIPDGYDHQVGRNNPSPLQNEGDCCDVCNQLFVIPARLTFYFAEQEANTNA
jgi:hypothetical protein